MRSVVLPSETRGTGQITKPVDQDGALVDRCNRVLPLDANPQAFCSRPSDDISLDCGYSTDAQSKLGCDTFVKPFHRWPASIDTESPIQLGTCLSRVLSRLSESGYENTLVPCSPQPSPLRIRLATAAGTLPIRLTCEVRPTRVLPSRMGKPTRGSISEARPGSPRPILAGFAPRPAAVWREDNGSP
jgi:hypothetical protein